MGVGYVGVDLSGADVGVSEKSLNRAKVGTVTQEVGRKTMTNDMRGDFAGNAGFGGVMF